MPVDEEPRAAAPRGRGAAPSSATTCRGGPDWDDEAFAGDLGDVRHRRVAAPRPRRSSGCTAAPRPDLLEPASRGLGSSRRRRSTLVDYLEARERLWAFARRILRGWPDGRGAVHTDADAPARSAGALQAEAGVTDDAVRFSALVRLWNVTGQPAISLPLHETADGVPVGVQLVGPPGRDDLLLSLAGALELSVGWRPR